MKILYKEVDGMGRDDHNKSKNNVLAQTPKQQLVTDGIDVEFLEEFADEHDKVAQARSKAADQRVKGKNPKL